MSESNSTTPNGAANAESAPKRSLGLGLCLCGGGITGALYEIGCLAAIEEAFEPFEFDVLVGSSSGSPVVTAIAGGISPTRMYRALIDPADDFFPLQRQHLLRLDGSELKRVWRSAWGALRRTFSSATANPLSLDVWEELDRFYDSLPAGLFTLEAFERFLIEFFRRRGIPQSFSGFTRKLTIVANDLDAGERELFGSGGREDVSVARAIAASCAVPLLFAPVRIGDRDFVDGGIGHVGHVDVAERHGADTILVINPMVPVISDPASKDIPTGHGRMRRVRDKGLLWVYNQSWRMRTETRFKSLLARFREVHPNTKVLLLEPPSDDANMFMYSPMNFAARRVILQDAYRRTMTSLLSEDSELRQAFMSKGLALRG